MATVVYTPFDDRWGEIGRGIGQAIRKREKSQAAQRFMQDIQRAPDRKTAEAIMAEWSRDFEDADDWKLGYEALDQFHPRVKPADLKLRDVPYYNKADNTSRSVLLPEHIAVAGGAYQPDTMKELGLDPSVWGPDKPGSVSGESTAFGWRGGQAGWYPKSAADVTWLEESKEGRAAADQAMQNERHKAFMQDRELHRAKLMQELQAMKTAGQDRDADDLSKTIAQADTAFARETKLEEGLTGDLLENARQNYRDLQGAAAWLLQQDRSRYINNSIALVTDSYKMLKRPMWRFEAPQAAPQSAAPRAGPKAPAERPEPKAARGEKPPTPVQNLNRSDGPATPKTKAEYDKLPSGTIYIDPQGKRRVKK